MILQSGLTFILVFEDKFLLEFRVEFYTLTTGEIREDFSVEFNVEFTVEFTVVFTVEFIDEF